jgi:CBS domain-containing protein
VERIPTVSMPITEVPVRDLMSPGVIALPEDTTVGACARALYERRTHAVLIVDRAERRPRGWIFHLDILKYLQSDPLTTVASEAVSQQAALIDPDATAQEAAERMLAENVTHLLVAQSPDSIPEGVLSTWDLVAFYARSYGHAR